MDLDAYLDRISYRGPLAADFETLRGLHRAHVTAIPYENLDVQLKRPLTTDPRAAWEKVVTRRRGGWCYEMNGTFALALEAAGFNVTRLAATGGDPASHLTLRVEIGGKPFVADVGFADGPAEPYPLVDHEFEQDGFAFRLELLENDHWRLHNHKFGVTPGFTAGGPDEGAMAERCHLLQTLPTSPFVQNATVFRRVDGGLVSLIGRVLRNVKPDGVSRQDINSADEYVATLKTRFALDVPEAETLWPQICARHEEVMAEQAARRGAREAAEKNASA